MPRHWPKHPRRPVVAAVIMRGDTEGRKRQAGPDHTPHDGTLCLACGHVRRVVAPLYTLTRMRHLGAICRQCPPLSSPSNAELPHA